MLYSGSLLLQSGALGEVPGTFGDCWALPAVARWRSRQSQFRWRWEKCRRLGQPCCQVLRRTPWEQQRC